MYEWHVWIQLEIFTKNKYNFQNQSKLYGWVLILVPSHFRHLTLYSQNIFLQVSSFISWPCNEIPRLFIATSLGLLPLGVSDFLFFPGQNSPHKFNIYFSLAWVWLWNCWLIIRDFSIFGGFKCRQRIKKLGKFTSLGNRYVKKIRSQNCLFLSPWMN